MRKHFWTKLALAGFIFCLTSCQPGGGDFVPLPQDNTVLESYDVKKDVVQVYDNAQVLMKVRGNWDVRFGASYFYIEITNKNQNTLIIEPNAEYFDTNLDEKVVANELSYSVRENPPGEIGGLQKLKEDKLKNGKIKIESGQKVELETSFHLNVKEYSKSKSYFLGKEVRLSIPIIIDGQENIYRFAFKYDSYQ